MKNKNKMNEKFDVLESVNVYKREERKKNRKKIRVRIVVIFSLGNGLHVLT